ncbi:MAG: hypothetical protein K6G90_13090 [Clostridia bacterium]|nr:hypothetical protein [Clostridia bacterium]
MRCCLKSFSAIVFAFLLAVFSLICSAAPAQYNQNHVVADYENSNSKASGNYYNRCGKALDGTAGNADLCIPGLSSEDDMVPQGIAVYKEMNAVLISAYSHADRGSVIFALDRTTGNVIAEYHIYRASGNTANSHFGGIAVSRYNLYIADYNSTISYIPLSALNVKDGSSVDLTISGTADAAAFMNGANTSFAGADAGMLWTGNFYHEGNSSYDRRASEESGAVLLCFPLSGGSSEEEWSNLTNGGDFITPAHTLHIPDSISDVQGAYLTNDKAYLSASYGRNADGTLWIADVDYDAGQVIKKNTASVSALPACEDVDIIDGRLYTLSESACYHYMGGDGEKPAKKPFDTIWEIDIDALTGTIRTGIRGLFQRIIQFFRNLISRLKGLF